MLGCVVLTIAVAALALTNLMLYLDRRALTRTHAREILLYQRAREVAYRAHRRELVANRAAAMGELLRSNLRPSIASTAVIEVISADENDRRRGVRREVDDLGECPSSAGPDTIRSAPGVRAGAGD